MSQRKSTEIFIQECKQLYGNTYDYNLVKYIHAKSKVKVICPKHGIFEIRPTKLLEGSGCQKCSRERTLAGKMAAARRMHNARFQGIDIPHAVKVISDNLGNHYAKIYLLAASGMLPSEIAKEVNKAKSGILTTLRYCFMCLEVYDD
jgi:hypothetical protein